MGKGTEVLTVQPQAPTVAEATRDKTPPLRTSMKDPVLVNSTEYKMLPGKLPRLPEARPSRAHEFSDRDLPVTSGKDTVVLAEQEQRQALDSIAFGNQPLVISSSAEDFPNNVADPDAVGREAKERFRRATEKQLEEMRDDLRDPKLLDVLARLLGHPSRERIYLDPLAISERGKQCGGGGKSGGKSQGSQSESSSGQTGQGGQSSLVVGGFRSQGGGGGGLGGGGGGDDPNDRRPYNLPPSHYDDFMGFEEQPMSEDEQLRHAMTILEGADMIPNDPLFPQFVKPHEEPLSASLDCMRPGDDIEGMDFDIDAFCDLSNDLSQYLSAEPMVPVEPAQETSVVSSLLPQLELPLTMVDLPPPAAGMMVEAVQPQSTVQPSQQVLQPLQVPLPVVEPTPQPQASAFPTAEESSDIKASIELIHLMRTQPAKRPLGGQVLSLSANVLSYPGGTPTTPLPPPPASPASSVHSSMAASPRPFTPAGFPPLPSPLPPPTPASSAAPLPSPRPPSTPGTPAPPSRRTCGPFHMDTSIRGDVRVFELSLSPELSSERSHTVVRAMFYINVFYSTLFQCAEQEIDLKVANDVHAKMCRFEFDSCELKVTLSMPKDCKPLDQWLKKNTDLKDRLLILQQVLNAIATVHTRGHGDDLSLWGSFMVWVGRDLRVYLLVDFPVLLRKQEEVAGTGERLDPRLLDVMALRDIYTNLVPPCIGKDDSWTSPALTNALRSFEWFLGDAGSSCRVAEAARILGEKRVCKVEVDVCYLTVVFYCLEREELHTALRELSQIAPAGIADTWAVQSVSDRVFMRVGDIVTADRRMQLHLTPCMHPSDTRLLYIHCQRQFN